MPPPGAQQKGPPPAAPGQKGAPQQQAQPPVAPPAPYAVLKVAPPKPATDPSLAAFRKELAGNRTAQGSPRAGQARDRAGLLLAQGRGNAAGKKTGIEALATALILAAKDGSGWETLAEFAADETAAPYPDRPNTVCSPAGRSSTSQDAGEARRDDQDRCRRLGLHLRRRRGGARRAAQNAPVIEKLGMQFVRVMPDTAPNASQDFMRIVTPSGKVGFVAAEAINPLGSDQLCYGKDAAAPGRSSA
jgi:hypothetical protein